MRSIVSKLMIAAVLLLGAQFAAPRATAVDLGGSIELGVSLDTTYQYVSNGEVGEGIAERGLYPEHNDFSIDAFTLSLEKVPTVGEGVMDQVGFRADVLFGEQAERLGFGFNSDGDGAVSPYQAYVNVLIPSGAGGLNIYRWSVHHACGLGAYRGKGQHQHNEVPAFLQDPVCSQRRAGHVQCRIA